MNEFDRDCRRVEPFLADPETFARGINQQRPNPFAAIQDRVAHRFMQSAGRAIDRRQGPVKPGNYPFV
jgi:hypothetical protein